MKITRAMILAAGLGSRLRPITLKTPKPLIKIGNKNLLQRSIDLLINHGINEIIINIHHLPEQIIDFVEKQSYKVQIKFSHEKLKLLDTGGGVYFATKSFNDKPFFVINPDTIWNDSYQNEIKDLENLYFIEKKPILLLVNKKISYDSSFKGDFNLSNKNLILRENSNKFIFTGLQILDRKDFMKPNKEIFSFNEICNKLINNNRLMGHVSKNIFYHLNTKEIYEKILKLKSIDL